MVSPLRGTDGDLGAPTINAKKRQQQAPWEVPELEIRERPPSTLRNVNGGPLGGVGARDPGAATINAKKHQQQGPWEVPELKIREHPPSMLRNIDGGPPGRCWRRSGSAHY
jgi:hypothetical protein